MQNAQLAAALSLPSTERYSVRQRLLSASVSLAMSGSAATTAAMANAPAPVFAPAPQATPVHSFANAGHTVASHAGFNAVGAASVSNLTHASVFSPLGLTASSSLHPVSSFNQATHGAIGSHPVFKTNSATHSTALTSATGQTDLNLTSVSPIFQAGGLAGFHNITIVVGGKEQLVTVDSKLTAAELVAAQQVLSGSKQEIKINASGVATGGYFDLSSSTVSALDGAIGGQLGSLVISHGVKAVDSLSTFDLTGSLINMGKIVMTTPGAGQSVDTINADNIYNRAGGVISSTASSGIGIGLDADNTFSNSGTVSSGGTLNISAPTVINAAESNPAGIVHAQPVLSAAQNVNFTTQSLTNSGLISSQSADINVVNGGGNNNIVVNGDGGTIQATKGNINFNVAGYDGSGAITLNGGDYYSKQVNLNDGIGAINANIGTVTGQLNGLAGSAHVTAATENMNLGNICVNGDPTYFNTSGNVTITGILTGDTQNSSTTVGDLAIVASGNIIANGGGIDTSAATANTNGKVTTYVNGGAITLVAGADFTTVPSASGSSTASGSGDTTTTLDMSGKASKTGGYIDLSGTFYTGNTSNKGISTFTSSATGAGTSGDITIVAYQGSSKFSGGIFATPNGAPSGTNPVTVNAAGGSKNGDITIVGGSAYYVFANGLEGNNISVTAGTPTPVAYTIKDGTVTGANFTVAPSALAKTTLFLSSVTASGNVTITGAGTVESNTLISHGNVDIEDSKGLVSLGVLNTAGQGGNGVGASNSGNGQSGGNGGNITINAGTISAALIDASGAGGAGGSSFTGVTGNGGNGGNGGTVNLNASVGNISVSYYLNASGGGGGGGAGANENSATVGAGGAGGHAGIVTINTKGSYVAGQVFGYSILDFDGAAGGAGGLSSATYGGGGGGGGTGFGGGGGGGAAGMGGGVGGGGAGTFVVGTGAGGAGTVAATAYAAYGGGGGSAAATSGNVFGTAGSLNTANAYSATNLTGVVIGGAASVIHENTTGTGLLYLNNGGNGGGYLSTSTALGGAGGGANGSGQGGLDGLSVTPPLSYGSSGGFTTTSTGAGAVYLTVGNVTGKANAPILVDGPKYYLTGTTKNASMYLSCGGDTLTLESASFVSGSTLNLSETHDQLIVAGPVTGASNVVLDGWQGVQVNNSITADKSITIIAGQTPFTSSSGTEQFGGNITTSGAGSIISAPTVSLTAYEELTSGGVSNLGGNITAHVAGVTSLAVNGQGNKSAVIPNTSLQIDTAAGKTTTITSGNAAGGFAITADGFGMVTSSKAITATNVIINADATIGSATKPLLTNASGSITVNGSSPNSVFVKDANVNTLTISGSGEAGESVTITSAAKTLKVGNFDFTNVNISDTYATAGQAASVTLGNLASDKIGDGTGTVIISSAAANIVGGTAGYVVQGTSVSISSKTGDIGTSTAAIVTDSANLSLSAAKGSVYAISQSDVDLGAIVALNSISVVSDGALNIGGAIGNASTASVYLESVGNMTDTSGSYVSGKAVSLFSNGDMGTADDVILTKASATFTLGSGASSNIYVTQNGKASLTASTLGPSSVLNFIDFAPLVVTGEIDGGTINITTPSLTLQAPTGNVSGKIFGTDITITSPVIAVKGADGITATDALTLTSATSLTITGVADSITSNGSLALGSVVNGKTTSAITLGDAKTGANNPLGSALNGGTDNLNILTTGNFTSSATSLVTAPVGGAGGTTGTIDFTAKAIVVEGTAPTTAFTFTANGNAIGSGGDVLVDFTGTQNVTLGSGAGQFQISNAGAAGTGNVAISAGGILTVNAGGLNGAPADLSLSGGKGLGVNSDILSANLSDVVLYSGAKTPFAVNAGGMSQANGTIGAIDSTNVAIGSAGPIVLTSGAINANNVSLSNNAGALTISGPVGSLGSNTTTLNLNAASGITLGDAKTGAGNPLDATFLSGLSNFSVNAGKGNFTSNISNFALNQASTDTLIIHAANIIATGSSAPTQFTFSVGSGSFSNLDLNLTGTQTVTISASAGTAKAPTYEVVNGAPNGQENINVGGILIVADKGGLTYNDNSELSLSGGKGLQIVDPTQFAQANTQLILNLSSGSASPLVVGAVSGTNYVAGNIDAGQLSITAKGGLTISSGASVTLTQGSTILFNTSKLTNNGTIAVSAAGGTLDLEGAAITVTNGTSASYDNIANLNVLCGSVNFGNLFSTPALLNTLNSLSVFAEGVVTVSSPINANSVDISASTIAYKGTGTALSIDASSVTLTSGAPLVIGTGKGAIDLSSTLSSLNLQSSGTVTLNESLTLDSGLPYNIIGSSIAVNSTFNGQNGGIGFFTAGVKGAVTTGAGATINGAELVLGGGSTILSKTALSIDASQVQLTGGGAWNIANAVGGSLTANTDIAALTYTSNGTVNVGGITTTAGNINLTTIGGNLIILNGSSLDAVKAGINLTVQPATGNNTPLTLFVAGNGQIDAGNGNIVLLNTSSIAGSSITFGGGLSIHASGTAAGVGQVVIAMGSVPSTSSLTAGVVPSGVQVVGSGGGGVYLGNQNNLDGTVDNQGSLILNADGRNVVINDNGNHSAIVFQGSNTITADPPVVFGAASQSADSHAVLVPAASLLAAPSLDSTVSTSSPVNAGGGATLYAPAQANQSALNVVGTASSARDDGRALQGEISNHALRQLQDGSLFIAPDVDTVVQTSGGSVNVAAGSVALLVAFKGGVAVYNMHDTKRGSVVVEQFGHKAALTPGRSIVLTNRSVSFFEEVNPAEFVGYRRVQAKAFEDGVKSFQAEFDVRTMLSGVAPLKAMLTSKEAHDKHVSREMLKTTAILMSATDATPYQLMAAPRLTAMGN